MAYDHHQNSWFNLNLMFIIWNFQLKHLYFTLYDEFYPQILYFDTRLLAFQLKLLYFILALTHIFNWSIKLQCEMLHFFKLCFSTLLISFSLIPDVKVFPLILNFKLDTVYFQLLTLELILHVVVAPNTFGTCYFP